MHYIRLLRPPSLDETTRLLKLVLTITTDLGDSFLCPDEPVLIAVYLVTDSIVITKNISRSVWSAGMRVLKLDLSLPAQAVTNIAEIPFDTTGRILGLSVSFPSPGAETRYTAVRELAIHTQKNGDCDLKEDEVVLQIAEEIGESIDRHVWDAGVVTTGLILDMCGFNATGCDRWCNMPLLRGLLTSAAKRPLNVIELGCGVGILGIGVAHAGSPASNEVQNVGRVLLTDLADAEEMTRINIGSNTQTRRGDANASSLELPLLDFEELDWEDGQDGVFGCKASATNWDLVIISDCTYNVDMLSALVKTLSALRAASEPELKVMLATKPRHSSEGALFDLMAAEGWSILENGSQPLPLLGMEEERVEIYLFGNSDASPGSVSAEVGDGVKHGSTKKRKLG
ncbi:putative methyltransferase-domain-containing protein [Coniella lustricola]|uniref:Putative methyltransferase-domain-containing protein n=1 Tax=Coniella lustricola TaxID=2025994 RepID=A0A2T3AB19_9PEZI|nr:putative methyltransferase-domain-containing protein [Coniella lustricola]